MAMGKTTMNVSITDSLKDMAKQQAEKNHFSTISDYIQHLIRTDADRQKAQEQFDAFIQKGIDSGDGKSFASRDALKQWMTDIIKKA